MSSDKRQRERWKAHYYFASGRSHAGNQFTVFEGGSVQPLGRLVDLTPEGLRITARERVEKGVTLALRVQLPDPIGTVTDILVKARCVWCLEDEESGEYHAGFAIDSISPPYAEVIDILID